MENNVFVAKITKNVVDIEESIEVEIEGKRIVAFTMDNRIFLEEESLCYIRLIPNIFNKINIKVISEKSKDITQIDGFEYLLTGIYDADN